MRLRERRGVPGLLRKLERPVRQCGGGLATTPPVLVEAAVGLDARELPHVAFERGRGGLVACGGELPLTLPMTNGAELVLDPAELCSIGRQSGGRFEARERRPVLAHEHEQLADGLVQDGLVRVAEREGGPEVCERLRGRQQLSGPLTCQAVILGRVGVSSCQPVLLCDDRRTLDAVASATWPRAPQRHAGGASASERGSCRRRSRTASSRARTRSSRRPR